MKKRMRVIGAMILGVVMCGPAGAQAGAPDPFAALAFLNGSWVAKTQGSDGVHVSGTYTFRLELGGHVMARHSTTGEGCKGPAGFDCDHGDLLYVYPEGARLKAIYFDNEGHVIHYDVSTPGAGRVEFVSEAGQPGPQFRLIYELRDGVMAGRFQVRMPGAADWRSYLEWSGGREKN